MEFLRFGSSIPGTYWGCCAVDIIQNFKVDPDEKASIQIVSGDSGTPVTNGGQFVFAGPTYRDIFKQRLRFGTFSKEDMPNHAFIAILTDYQLKNDPGKKWLQILKEEGFEFIRSVDNSVYTGPDTIKKPGVFNKTSSHVNHIFMLVRNIGSGAIQDPMYPPKEWTDLKGGGPELYEHLSGDFKSEEFTKEQQKFHLDRWEALGKPKLLSEKEVEKAGAPVIYAGLRSKYPQQPKEIREARIKEEESKSGKGPAHKTQEPSDPFAVAAA